jgi:hypothetical protein
VASDNTKFLCFSKRALALKRTAVQNKGWVPLISKKRIGQRIHELNAHGMFHVPNTCWMLLLLHSCSWQSDAQLATKPVLKVKSAPQLVKSQYVLKVLDFSFFGVLRLQPKQQ